MSHPISIDEAYKILFEHAGEAKPITVKLTEAVGHYLAEDVPADRDMPPFDRAMMDGFAVRAEDTSSSRVELEVIETVLAGQSGEKIVGSGQATRIMTGAPVPEGADAVVMIEETTALGEERVKINAKLFAGQNIAPRSSDVKAGEVLLRAGVALGPAEIGILAAVGCSKVPVFRKPRLAVMGTGDELLEPEQVPGPSQIRNSNSYQIVAQAAANGLEAEYLGIAPDDESATRKLIERGLAADVLISTGGVSAGDRDLVGEAYSDLGVEIHFSKVAVKPGKPTLFGSKGETLIFGLPGNPVAALVCFHLFVMTALRKRMGMQNPLPVKRRYRVRGSVKAGGPRPTFRPARLDTAGETVVVLMEWHGSGHLAACAGADGFVYQPAGEALEDGQSAEFYALKG